MREIHVIPAAEWPFGPEADPVEAIDALDRLAGSGRDVITNEERTVIAFLDPDDTEALLTDPRFGASVAMVVLHMSGVYDGPLYDLWSLLIFADWTADPFIGVVTLPVRVPGSSG